MFLCQYTCVELTFFLISVSVSVPADFELTGESVPSTESSLRNFSGEAGWMCEFPWCRGIPSEVGGCVLNVIGVDVAISLITVVLLLLKVMHNTNLMNLVISNRDMLLNTVPIALNMQYYMVLTGVRNLSTTSCLSHCFVGLYYFELNYYFRCPI